jgi:hypothetical protein
MDVDDRLFIFNPSECPINRRYYVISQSSCADALHFCEFYCSGRLETAPAGLVATFAAIFFAPLGHSVVNSFLPVQMVLNALTRHYGAS